MMILVIGAGFQCTKSSISVATCNPAEDADLPLHVAAGRALREMISATGLEPRKLTKAPRLAKRGGPPTSRRQKSRETQNRKFA
jgi:hypothetical protein